MSYPSRGGSGYGGRHRRTVFSVQRSRSEWAKQMDARMEAPIAKTREQWKNDPSHFDWPNVDTIPKPKLKKRKSDVELVKSGLLKPKIMVEHKTKEDTNMTYLERAHLFALAKKFDIDRAEIDHKLSYDENKEYLEQLARRNASNTQNDLDRASVEADKWAGAYQDFMNKVSEDDEQWKNYFS